MPVPDWLTLHWNGHLLGRITEVRITDWPWVCGQLALSEWPPDLRTSVESLSLADELDDDLPDSSWQPEHDEGWTVVDPTGAVSEIIVPRIDFTTGNIEWR